MKRAWGFASVLGAICFFFYAGVAFASSTICGTISADTTLTNQVYVVTCPVTVDSGATLTIESGAILKFEGDEIIVDGTLDAEGTTTPVYFTSYKDDSIGGDTNGDGSSTSPAPADWVDIEVDSGGDAIMDNAVVAYGGYCSFASCSDIYNNGGTLSISNSQISNAYFYGVKSNSGTTTIGGTNFFSNSEYGISATGGNLSVATSTFSGGAAAAQIAASVDFTHSDNTASSTNVAGFLINGDVSSNQEWQADNIPYVLSNGGFVTIDSGSTLTVDPAAVVKFGSAAYLYVDGTLDVEGATTSPAYFTSMKDDSIDGDTNDDGTSTSPSAGDWEGIKVDSGGVALLNNAAVDYAGYCHFGSDLCTEIKNDGELNLYNSEVSNSASFNVNSDSGTTTITDTLLSTSSEANLSAEAGTLNVSSTTFAAGTYAGQISNSVNFIHSNNIASTSSGTIAGFYMNGDVTLSHNWSEDGPPYVINGFVTIDSGATLNLAAGAVVQFAANSELIDNGTLNANGNNGEAVYLTSLRDDSIDGDTNGDGTTTSPAPGDWEGVEIDSSGNATLTNTIVSYAGECKHGGDLYADLYNDSGTLNLFDSQVSNAQCYGVEANGGTNDITGTEINNNEFGYLYEGGSSTFLENIIHDNSPYGMYNSSGATTTAENNYWGASSGPYNLGQNPSGAGDHISDQIDFSNYATNSVMQAYTDLSITAVSTSTGSAILAWDFLNNATTTYLTEWDNAIGTWESLYAGTSGVNIATSSSPTLQEQDVANPYATWKGDYVPSVGSSTASVLINTDQIGGLDANGIQNIFTHELGHALGLVHSYSGNIMYPLNSEQITLGVQDTSDYESLWGI